MSFFSVQFGRTDLTEVDTFGGVKPVQGCGQTLIYRLHYQYQDRHYTPPPPGPAAS